MKLIWFQKIGRRVWLLLGLLLAVTGCSGVATEPSAVVSQPVPATLEATAVAPLPTTTVPELPDLGPAPELANDVWINSEPLTLAGLQGKVVLIEFWTFG